MVLEEEIPQFLDWLPGALVHWMLVALVVAGAGLAIGLVLAVLRSGPAAGAENFWRTFVDALADIFQTSLRRIWALARLAIQESLHRMVLVAFAVFVLILLFGAWYLDTTTAQPAKLYLSVVLTVTSYLSLLLALFLSVFSIPNDIANRTIHTVVTKPVRTSEIILGRVLGFSAVGTVMLTVTGVISYVFVIRGLSHTHEVEADSVVEIPDASGGEFAVVREARTQPEQNHRHQVAIERNGAGRTDVEHGHWHEVQQQQRGGDAVYVTGRPQGALTARVPIYGKLRFRDRSGQPTNRGINVGYESTYRSYIEGGSLAAAEWRFDGIRTDVFPDGELPLELTIQVFRTHKGKIEEGVLGAIVLRNPETKLATEPKVFQIKEFSADLHHFSRNLQNRNGQPIDLFDDLVANEQLDIEITCLDQGQYFGMAQADVYLRAADASFTANFIKGYFGIWLQTVLLTGFGVMFSTFLNSAVAMLATLATMVGGFFTKFIGELAAAEVVGGGPVESLVRMVTQNNVTAELNPSLATDVIVTSDDAARILLGQLQTLLPDLATLSNADFVSNGFFIPGNMLWIHAVTTLGYLLPVLVVAFFLFKAREVAA